MTSLENIQLAFQQAVLDKNASLGFISSPIADERFNVYRQTVLENLCNSLSITFPGIWKLIGEECAKAVAFRFAFKQGHLPQSGCLEDWGSIFPKFLSSVTELKSLPYLEDYAQFEWLQHLAYGAKACEALIAQDLQKVPEALIDDLRIQFLPCVFFFNSNYPINKIQTLVDDPNMTHLALNQDRCFGVITRHDSFWIEESTWMFLNYLSQQCTLKDANNKTLIEFDCFNLADALHWMLTHQIAQSYTINLIDFIS